MTETQAKQPTVITMTYSPPFRVDLTYFKSSGKYYSGGDYLSRKLYIHEIFEEVEAMLSSGTRPGLVDGQNEFYVIIDVPDHPHNHPHLILPDRRPTE